MSVTKAQHGLSNNLKIALYRNAALITVILVFIAFYVFYNLNHPRGFSTAVYIQNTNEVFALAMVAMAQTIPVLMGGLDLSVGAIMTLVNCVASHLLHGSPLQIILGFIICMLTGAACGFLNGCVVVYGRIQPIIATLATGAIFMGIALFLRPSPGGDVDGDLSWVMTNDLYEIAATYGLAQNGDAAWFQHIAWIPVPLVLLVFVALLIWLPFARSVTGRTVYAIGSSEGAAYMSGLAINKAKIAAFTLGGFFCRTGWSVSDSANFIRQCRYTSGRCLHVKLYRCGSDWRHIVAWRSWLGDRFNLWRFGTSNHIF